MQVSCLYLLGRFAIYKEKTINMLKELLLTVISICGLTAAKAPDYIIPSTQQLCCESEEEDNDNPTRSNPTFTYFNGTATDIDISDTPTVSSFSSTIQHRYFRFVSNAMQYLKINYVGPTAKLRIFYANLFTNDDYLLSVQDVGNSIDCYYFEKDAEYILDFETVNVFFLMMFTIRLEVLTLSSLANHEKYLLHISYDSTSQLGYRYQTEYYNVDTTSSSSTGYYVNNYAPSGTSYLSLIDSTNYFYDNPPNTFTDNRRLVYDTGYDEFSAVAYCSDLCIFNNYVNSYSSMSFRASGTFISENVVMSCAHIVHNVIDNPNHFNPIPLPIIRSGLCSSLTFNPGINSYTNEDYYGTYKASHTYVPVSYVLKFGEYNYYLPDCAEFDWSLNLTTKIANGSRTHSYMGIGSFSYPASLDKWTHARNAGYPKLQSNPTNNYYKKAIWVSYPLENDVVINGNIVSSKDIVVSGGNSGGPLYYRTSTIYQGQLVVTLNLIGIASGCTRYKTDGTGNFNLLRSFFCRGRPVLVNLVKEITSLT